MEVKDKCIILNATTYLNYIIEKVSEHITGKEMLECIKHLNKLESIVK